MRFFDVLRKIFAEPKVGASLKNTPVVKQAIKFDEILIPNISKPWAAFLSGVYEVGQSNNYEAFFENGELVNVNPRNKSIPLYEDRKVANVARFVVSGGIRYDLENPDDIRLFKIPDFKELRGMPNTTLDLAYIMRMKANKEFRAELAVPLCYKTANLMLASPIGWNRKDYYMIIKHLWIIGEIEYGDYLEAKLRERNVLNKIVVPHINRVKFAGDSNFYNCDIVESNDTFCCCSECAKYTKRWFSVSGKSKKYPKLPEYFKKDPAEHQYCAIEFFPIIDGVSHPSWSYDKSIDFVDFCNRPYIDRRTDAQKIRFEEYKKEREKEDAAEDRYCSRDYWVNKYNAHFEYQKVVDCLGLDAPKSFSDYSRMKNKNTKGFCKIKAALEQRGVKI